MIRIEHLKKQYPNVTPLEDVSVEINDGGVISVIGPSGTARAHCFGASTCWKGLHPAISG